jgi:hypothetical protein
MTRDEILAHLRSPQARELRYFPHAVAEELSDLAPILREMADQRPF